ncbi:Uncharacterised protein [Mycobacteroides abscessus subsp. bolletii]|uniref:hypothetical protein n=1 Tax=Mycobacteroides abscessus TaxID=36809 RepID=UPI0009CBC36C|nr:hypothetical protein [Mycobacteroides abscessus]SKS14016.1 Uncharacterised protein [Mycobacteroides abscessus subsp. bolletii]SKS29529.1 Uncharacterised protein [Mycobacteroides abscessus subsp. bolletii]
MANQLLVDLLTRTFAAGALQHPGDANSPARVIPIPGFRATGMPDDQAQEMIGQAAKLWAEAIESVIDSEFDVLTKADAAQLRQDAAEAPDGTRIVTLYDRTDHQRATPLLVLTVGKTDDVTIDARQLRKFLAQ